MRKVKITVLRKTIIEDLAKEYGVDGLSKCPMLKEGQVFTLIMQSLMVFAMKHGKQSISMYLLWLMVLQRKLSTSETG